MLRWAMTALLALTLGACCPCERADPKKLPPPITQAEQFSRLNARIKALPRIKAKTVTGGVEVRTFRDGREQSEPPLEATLMLRQQDQGGPDVMLLGTSFNNTVLRAGRNATAWWLGIYQPEKDKMAVVGDSRLPIDWSQFTQTGGKLNPHMMRVDPVPDLLALRPFRSEVSWEAETAFMRVNDWEGTNDIFVLSRNGPILRREIRVDRVTGEVREVRLYGPDGILVVRAKLTEYKLADNAEPGGIFPRRVDIEYPASKVKVTLRFESVIVPPRVSDVTFELPDFAAEGLPVIAP